MIVVYPWCYQCLASSEIKGGGLFEHQSILVVLVTTSKSLSNKTITEERTKYSWGGAGGQIKSLGEIPPPSHPPILFSLDECNFWLRKERDPHLRARRHQTREKGMGQVQN